MAPLTPASGGECLGAASWRQAFDEPAPMTVGIEEELMVLDAQTLDLAPDAALLAADAGDDDRIRTELPAAQLELVTRAAPAVGDAVAELTQLRHTAAALASDRGLCLAGAGAHPFAAPVAALSGQPRYERLADEYGPVARRQLVFGLHVHVGLRGADRVLAVYNALREHLPTLAALAANAPLYDGRDCGLASVRPKLSELLPRQGVPPAFASWDAVAAAHAWGRASGRVPDAGSWWWEARLHPRWATLEVRVPDTQTTVAETAAVVALVHALVARLAERHDAGDLSEPAEDWRIAENRWSACRHGLDAQLADLRTGATTPARELLAAMVEDLGIDATSPLVRQNGSERLREIAREDGVRRATAWLSERFAS